MTMTDGLLSFQNHRLERLGLQSNKNSVEIDLHGYHVGEAIDQFLTVYNQNVHAGLMIPIQVIHGYGSSGEGGKIRSRLRMLLKLYPEDVSFISGESLDNNPGYTLVSPERALPSSIDLLRIEIMEYCKITRSKDKIAGEFRQYGAAKILKALRALEKRGLLSVSFRGKHKFYQSAE